MWKTFLEFLSENRWPLSFLSILGFIGCVLVFLRASFNTTKQLELMRKRNRLAHLKYKFRLLCSYVVERLSVIPVLGDMIKNMTHNFVCQFAITEENARYLTGKCLVLFITSFLFSFTGSMFYFKDIILSLIAAIMLGKIVLKSVSGKPLKFLSSMEDAIDDFIHAFHENGGNIDHAFYTIINSSSSVSGHFAKMYDHIQRAYVSPHPETVQKEYYAVAPARVLRNLYTVIYMTYKYGDTYVDGKSQFTQNLFTIQQDLIEKIYSCRKLSDSLMGERWFIILPIFALPMLSKYMLTYFSFEGFELIEEFVKSPLGYTVEIICAAVSLISFFLYEKMTDDMVIEKRNITSWENKVLRDHRVYNLVQKIVPKNSPKRIRLQTTLIRSGSVESAEAFTIRRIVATAAICIVCIFSIFLNNLTTINRIKNNIYQGLAQEAYHDVLLAQNDVNGFIKEQISADKIMLKYIKKIDGWKSLSDDEKKETLAKYLRKESDYNYRGFYKDAATRIVSKDKLIRQTGGLFNIVFILLFTIGGYFTPVILIGVQSMLNKETLISDETADLQAVTMMLISHENCTPQQLVMWCADSAVLFAQPFYEAAVSGSFDSLKHTTTYKPFCQLVDCMAYAYGGMDMKSAFSDLEQKVLIQKRERARLSDLDVQNRITRVEYCSSLSMYAALGLYMFMPILVAMVQMFKNFSSVI